MGPGTRRSSLCAVVKLPKVLLQFCDPAHPEPDVVQVASYGLGVGFQVTPKVFLEATPEACQRLLAVVQTHAKQEEWDSCFCNAVSALLKALDAQGAHRAYTSVRSHRQREAWGYRVRVQEFSAAYRRAKARTSFWSRIINVSSLLTGVFFPCWGGGRRTCKWDQGVCRSSPASVTA